MKTLAKILLLLLAVAALAVPLSSIADETGITPERDTWLVVTVGSRHHKRGYNEHNWGLGLEHGVSEYWRLVVGTYKNSFYRDTIYLGAMYTPFSFAAAGGTVRLGGAVLYASGYEPQPVVLPFPMIAYEQKHWGLNVGPILPTVVGFQLKLRY